MKFCCLDESWCLCICECILSVLVLIISLHFHEQNCQTPVRDWRKTCRVLERVFRELKGVSTQCKTPCPRAGTWAFPSEPESILTHWTQCFVGFPQPWGIKTVTITLTNRHQNCNKQVLSGDTRVVTIHLSTLILCFSFFLFPYTFS